MTSKEIAEKIGASRITISKYLERLEAEGILSHRQVGAYKVWYVEELAEKTRKMLPKRIIVALGKSFLRIFEEKAYEIALNVGEAIIDEIYDILPLEEEVTE